MQDSYDALLGRVRVVRSCKLGFADDVTVNEIETNIFYVDKLPNLLV